MSLVLRKLRPRLLGILGQAHGGGTLPPQFLGAGGHGLFCTTGAATLQGQGGDHLGETGQEAEDVG